TIWSRTACQVITPNPKTSGGAPLELPCRVGLRAGKERRQRGQGARLRRRPAQARAGAGYRRARATTTFVERGVGDVLLAWENEAFLALEELGPDKFDIVVPSLSILAEPPVAIVDKVVDKKGTRAAAQAYLEFLYTPAAQEIIAKNYYRPLDKTVAAKYEAKFPKVKLVTIDDKIFGGWRKAQKDHFSDGGTFDQIYQPQKK
ncbi:sulfate transporter subunit, partial [Methylobacterium radiotolerans]